MEIWKDHDIETGNMAMKSKAYKSVWDAIADTPGEAANLKIRSELMIVLEKLIKDEDLTQKEAAELLGVTQPRVSDLLRGKINLFSIDTLVNMLQAAGMSTRIKIAKVA
jgi:predicted XRE-type DNA-binding protein